MIKRERKSASMPTTDEISRRAYEIFVARGRPHGRDVEHWLEAEAQLKAVIPARTARRVNRPGTSTRVKRVGVRRTR
jgi:heme oxygenase